MRKRAGAAREPWLSARRLAYFSIGGIFLLISLGLYIWVAATESAAQSWPTATGEVVESKVERVSGRNVAYAPVIHYRYEVDGTVYRGRKIELTDHPNFGSAEEAADYAAHFPPGAEVIVHYDPADPATAALYITSSRTIIYVFAGVALIFAFVGLYRR